MRLSHVVSRLGQVFKLLWGGSWLEGLFAGWARLRFRMARDLCAVAHAQAAEMLGFRMQFVPVHVSLRCLPLGAGCVLTSCGVEASWHGLPSICMPQQQQFVQMHCVSSLYRCTVCGTTRRQGCVLTPSNCIAPVCRL